MTAPRGHDYSRAFDLSRHDSLSDAARSAALVSPILGAPQMMPPARMPFRFGAPLRWHGLLADDFGWLARSTRRPVMHGMARRADEAMPPASRRARQPGCSSAA